ncbi:hypothetical protein ACMYYO_11135 [Dermacoccaceae bacterium W4C1]
MSKSWEPMPKVYSVLHRPVLAMVTIGALADEAVRRHSSLVHQGDDAERTAIKVDGSSVATYWREGARAWIDHNPDADVVWSEAVDNGWPEYLVADKYHVFLHRRADFSRTARSAVLDHQGTDTYMWFPSTLPSLDEETVPSVKRRITVRVIANHDERGRMTGADVSAPRGKDSSLFRFTIGADEVTALKARWVMHEAPWLATINLLGSMSLPDVGTGPVSYSASDDTQRPEQDTGGAAAAVAGEEGVRPQFKPTEHTQRPAQEPDDDEQSGSADTGTDR